MVKGSGRSAAEVERIVADFARSGLSRREYSERHGIALPTLDWYGRRVRASRGAAAKLVQVKIEEPAATAPSASANTALQGVALVLSNGRRIETSWSFDEKELTRLIRIAGAA